MERLAWTGVAIPGTGKLPRSLAANENSPSSSF